jgi:hypothetical protein
VQHGRARVRWVERAEAEAVGLGVGAGGSGGLRDM